jgi:magnesium-protoporphyrin O-methyltransferase
MSDATYFSRRGELEAYFDRTAVETWKRLTSNEPLGRIRATVRAGRDAMRQLLLSYLPPDLSGARLLDAGCGTGALAIEAANRGADVLAIDLSSTLVNLAKERASQSLAAGRLRFAVGDMLDPALGCFEFVVAMDSLIHYRGSDLARALGALAPRTSGSMVFTIAPRTPALTTMHAVGRLLPRGNRAPAIEPISRSALECLLHAQRVLDGWRIARARRITSGFYFSEAIELLRS